MFNSTKHRDEVTSNQRKAATGLVESAFVQKIAAERIQRVWRTWHEYCKENADWMTTTWICATIIQARWRSYHVRRLKFDRAADVIQRHVRGFLVRQVLKRHAAAVTIQRHIVGILTRKQLLRLHLAALKAQSLVRGAQSRKRVQRKRDLLTKTAIKLQCAVRSYLSYRAAHERRVDRDWLQTQQRAVLNIQCHYRGWKGRCLAETRRRQYLQALLEYYAATRLQSMVRRYQALERTDLMRARRLKTMIQCSIFIQRMWRGFWARRQYLALLDGFKQHENHIVIVQRFARGFLVRSRLWQEAIRAEEELWAAVEVQRVWRGYRGRVAWEDQYEVTWLRELAAAMLARCVRGWLARIRVSRMQHKIARAEFEKARCRFRSAQAIQALMRGFMDRKLHRGERARVLKAVVCMQRIWRGHSLRKRLWNQVVSVRSTMIGAAVRGFLVRRRRFKLICNVVCIQRAYRRWLRTARHERTAAFGFFSKRKRGAVKIQRHFRQHLVNKAVEHIQEENRLWLRHAQIDSGTTTS